MVMNSAKVEDPLLQGAVREAWWWAATEDVQITVQMIIPDMLSRASFSGTQSDMFDHFVESTDEVRLIVPVSALKPPMNA